MSTSSVKVDENDLFKELQTAIDEDKKYWLQNDAKIRAAVTSKSYDDFRNIVAAAHLTPLSLHDKARKVNRWNTVTKMDSEQK